MPRKVWALDFQLSIRLFPQRAEVQQGQVAAKLRDPREEVDRPEGAPEEEIRESHRCDSALGLIPSSCSSSRSGRSRRTSGSAVIGGSCSVALSSLHLGQGWSDQDRDEGFASVPKSFAQPAPPRSMTRLSPAKHDPSADRQKRTQSDAPPHRLLL